MRSIQLTIDETPIPASRPRVTKYSTYYKEPYLSYKAKLLDYMTKATSGYKNPVFAKYEPLHIDIIFYMPIPKSISKKKAKLLLGSYHTKKPDKDNLEKAVLDSMNGLMYYDDGQICSSTVKKIYSDKPRTEINIQSLDYETAY